MDLFLVYSWNANSSERLIYVFMDKIRYFLREYTRAWFVYCTIANKTNFNVTPKGVYLPISKLHSISAEANLLAHNNISQICYCSQFSLQSR